MLAAIKDSALHPRASSWAGRVSLEGSMSRGQRSRSGSTKAKQRVLRRTVLEPREDRGVYRQNRGNRGYKRSLFFEPLENRVLLTYGLPATVSINAAGIATGNATSTALAHSLSGDGRYQV